jgi:hypothetical protein
MERRRRLNAANRWDKNGDRPPTDTHADEGTVPTPLHASAYFPEIVTGIR